MELRVLTLTLIIVIVIRIEAQDEQRTTCGRRLVHHEALISNGLPTKHGDWPWHVAIFHIGKRSIAYKTYKCGGTLLSSSSVLTAAHCVIENNQRIIPERILVNLGKHNLIIAGANTQEFEAHKIIPHPNYNFTYLHNDIAIIRLSTEATFNNYVQPICLWDINKLSFSDLVGLRGTVVGWGITETDQLSLILRQAVMPVVPTAACINSNPDFKNYLTEKNFCAGFRNGTSVCEGDSGGSITYEENGVYYIRGIVSLTLAGTEQDNDSCISKDFVIFTDVTQYLPWIEEVARLEKHSVDDTLPEERNWESAKIYCSFGRNNDEKRYECVDRTFSSTEDNVRISSVEGSFTDGRTYSDVNTVIINGGRTTYVPEMSALKKIFSIFTRLFITNSHVKYVERSKLKRLSQLRILNFFGNEIETLNEDVLYDLPHLEIFAFVQNRIRILPVDLLSKQLKLKELWAWDNQIESIPRNFFKNNKELTHAWLGSNLLKKIDVKFNQLLNLKVLDLRANKCIDEQACETCRIKFNEISDIADRNCN